MFTAESADAILKVTDEVVIADTSVTAVVLLSLTVQTGGVFHRVAKFRVHDDALEPETIAPSLSLPKTVGLPVPQELTETVDVANPVCPVIAIFPENVPLAAVMFASAVLLAFLKANVCVLDVTRMPR